MEVSKDTKLLGYARIKTDDGQFATAKILSDSTVWLEDGTVFTAPPEQMAHFMRMMEHTEREEKLMSAARGIMHSVAPNEEIYKDAWDIREEKKAAEEKAAAAKDNKKNQQKAAQNKPSNTKPSNTNTRTVGTTPVQSNNAGQRQQANRTYVEPKRPSSQPAVVPKKGEKKKLVVFPLVLFTLIVIMGAFLFSKWQDGTIPAVIHNIRFPDNGVNVSIMDEVTKSEVEETEEISEEEIAAEGTAVREDAKNAVTVMVIDGGETIEILTPKNL